MTDVLPFIPADDDIVLACAIVGQATHLGILSSDSRNPGWLWSVS